MATRANIVEEARKWLHTPYKHQGRLPGVAIDCAGLLVCVAQKLGLPWGDMTAYPRRPNGTLQAHLDKHMDRVLVSQAQAGDVLVFNWRGQPSHLAILTSPNTIIHAFAINREVVEHSLNAKWRAFIVGAYAYRGLE